MKQILFIAFLVMTTSLFGQSVSSHLPVINIQSSGEIPDEPRIQGTMGIMSNSNMNSSDGPFNEYNGDIGIEIRGNSSQDFDKKSYTIELRDNSGNAMSQSLLGMGADSEWVLHALFIDKTLLRIPMSFYLHEQMGESVCSWQYVEVVVNDDYKGIYALIEKIRQGAERVNIADINAIDNTGGYLFKVDWVNEEEASFNSEYSSMGGPRTTFEYIYPKGSQVTIKMESFIEQRMYDWESALFSTNFINAKGEHYTKWIDSESFASFLLINEFSKNSDGYKLSSYFHKDNDGLDPRFHAGPIWDFDQTYGLSAVCSNSNPRGWTFLQNQPGCEDLENMPLWWEHLTKDPSFCNLITTDWTQYRNSFLNKDSLYIWIDNHVNYLGDAITRNFERWNIIGEDVWIVDYETPTTYEGEITYMKNWIDHRLAWMDSNIGNICAFNNQDGMVNVFPNPANDIITVKMVPGSYTAITDIGGRLMAIHNESYSSSFSLDISSWSAGIYIVFVRTTRGTYIQKFVKV
ncbi:MAG: hypothetical protein COA32_07685 [Fluviicola sp.]|nr:MAG: hypothetical protein COA32_07685 [Fluviicola sp.]